MKLRLLRSALVLALMLAFVAGTFGSDNLSSAGPRVLLLAEPNLPPDRLPFTATEGQRLGVERFSTFGEMQEAAEGRFEAIIVERGARDQVDWNWVATQFGQGKVIVGMNINMADLLRLLGPSAIEVFGNERGWPLDGGGYADHRRYFSVVVRNTGVCASSGYQHFDQGLNPRIFLAFFNSVLSCATREPEPGAVHVPEGGG